MTVKDYKKPNEKKVKSKNIFINSQNNLNRSAANTSKNDDESNTEIDTNSSRTSQEVSQISINERSNNIHNNNFHNRRYEQGSVNSEINSHRQLSCNCNNNGLGENTNQMNEEQLQAYNNRLELKNAFKLLVSDEEKKFNSNENFSQGVYFYRNSNRRLRNNSITYLPETYFKLSSKSTKDESFDQDDEKSEVDTYDPMYSRRE
uniref:Uncharacterized protein n=1 Tax=Strongyloides stercoralis TaxID=6248 RepID=A0A0K0E5T8_STRER